MTNQTKHQPGPCPPAEAGGVADPANRLLAGILAGDAANIDVEDYLAAFNVGIAHDDIIAAAKERLEISHYTVARTAGINHKRILLLNRTAKRRRGAHKGVLLSTLVEAIELGISCEEILEVCKAKNRTDSYLNLRADGACHDELMEAAKVGINLADYAWGWPEASHRQLMDAQAKRVNVRQYARLRAAHAEHDEALCQLAGAPNSYNKAS
jgi:hypothetical protein